MPHLEFTVEGEPISHFTRNKVEPELVRFVIAMARSFAFEPQDAATSE